MADNLTRLIRDWLTKAAHDLQNARIVSATSDGPLDTAIYHCQKKRHVQQATTCDLVLQEVWRTKNQLSAARWWSRRATPGAVAGDADRGL